MKIKNRLLKVLIFCVGLSIILSNTVLASVDKRESIDKYIESISKEKSITGLTIVIVDKDKTTIKNLGYADKENGIKVSDKTKFELASCSKSFTALAAEQLAAKGAINLDDPISKYLKGFNLKYKGENQIVTIKQLLHHTSGIPNNTIYKIPESSSKSALDDTVNVVNGIELNNKPGTVYEYATINYDIVASIIEKASGMNFEEYMDKNIFKPLGLKDTSIGKISNDPLMAKGYKIGFFKPRLYDAPTFKGNDAAGYIVTDALDMERWLKIQLGLVDTELSELVLKTHLPDRTVMPNKGDMASYSEGWFVYQDGNGEISHSGQNPNFTSYITFRPEEKTAVAVLANSNSGETISICKNIMSILNDKEPTNIKWTDSVDNILSIIFILIAAYLLFIVISLIWTALGMIKGNRYFRAPGKEKIIKFIACALFAIPLLFAVYILPKAMLGTSWKTAKVWAPTSFVYFADILICAVIISFVLYIFLSIFPHKNSYKKDLPVLIILSLVSGVANSFVIFLVSNTSSTVSNAKYLIFYYLLIFLLYIFSRKIVETKLIKTTQDIIYDLRVSLFNKIFKVNYQEFEKIEKGKIITTFNNDINQLGNSANIIITAVTSIITIICAFVYLCVVSFWATIITVAVIAIVAVLFYIVSQKTRVYWEQSRDIQNTFMEKVNGLLDGFKELALHIHKKEEYKKESFDVSEQFRAKVITALTKFINSFLIGESFFIIALGIVALVLPLFNLFGNRQVLAGYIMVLLYILGSIRGILTSIPNIMQISVSARRVKGFINDIPSAENQLDDVRNSLKIPSTIDNVEVRDVTFEYDNEGQDSFSVGPISLKVNKGQAVFIIGGNGSGKTTLIKLLTGLYSKKTGDVLLDGKSIKQEIIGEYISIVFSDVYLFERLYDIDCKDKQGLIEKYLKELELDGKVKIEDGRFSTTKLSTGQRKRLALLRCYLEDKPIFIFDELAADQDPQFRSFFYTKLIPEMKAMGKIVIAITHDDHYFNVADRVVKMDLGQIESEIYIEESAASTEI